MNPGPNTATDKNKNGNNYNSSSSSSSSSISINHNKRNLQNYGTMDNSHEEETPLDMKAIVEPMLETHRSHRINHDYKWRRDNLLQLKKMIKENKKQIVDAVHQDMKKVEIEIWAAECLGVLHEIDTILWNLKKWMRPVAKAAPTHAFPSYCQTRRVPLREPGVLVIGPFNYPIYLTLIPTVGAIAGGNPVVIKPSELCPATANLLQELVEKYFQPGVLQVVQGAIPETTQLLKQEWGKIHFTGSGRVGKIIAGAAAKTLTPCVLELGGKSPVYVDNKVYNIPLIAERLVWGKFFNAGQTCVGIDYILLHKDIADKVLECVPKALERQFGANPEDGEMSRIVQVSHALRLVELLKQVEQEEGGGGDEEENKETAVKECKVLVGGSKYCKPEEKYVAPTMVLNPPKDCRLMTEEIFGPIMPLVIVESREEAKKFIKEMEGTPLALYVFTTDNALYEDMLKSCPAATICRNDSCAQFSSSQLPAGGLGTSGYGSQHGRASFETFTHERSEMHRPLVTDLCYLKYHPYAGIKTQVLDIALNAIPDIPILYTRRWLVLGVAVLAWVFCPYSAVKEPVANGLADGIQHIADFVRSS